jgi:DNA-binding transcriptional LysR family regulator
MMNWDDLRYLLAVARNGSMSAAARALNVNHATVIRRIRSLEEQLNTSLFDRIGHNYVITPAGQVAFDAAEQMEAQSTGVERLVVGQATDLSGTIVVTAPEPMSETLLVPLVKEFTAQYPDILIDLSLSMRVYDLGMREADVAFRVTNNPPEDVVGTRLVTLAMGVYAPAGSGIKTADITEIISFSGGEPSTVDWKKRYAPQARIRLQTDSATTAMHGIKAGLGVARLPIAIGEADPGLERVPDIPLEQGMDVWLLTHVEVRTNARIRVFRDFVQGFYAERRPQMEGEGLEQAQAALG